MDPCEVNICPAHPDATCIANYCGGCHAIFLDASGNRLRDCNDKEESEQLEPEDSDVAPDDMPLCEGGQVYNKCGSSCFKVKTCSDPNPKTDDFCTEECVMQCECPADRPIWRNGQCITEDQCKTDPIQGTTTMCSGQKSSKNFKFIIFSLDELPLALNSKTKFNSNDL